MFKNVLKNNYIFQWTSCTLNLFIYYFSISNLRLKDDGLHLTKVSAMKLNAAIADYDQSESSPTPNCEENKTQIKNWERFCNKFTYNSMPQNQRHKIVFKS